MVQDKESKVNETLDISKENKHLVEKAIDIRLKHIEFRANFLSRTYYSVLAFVLALIVSLINSGKYITDIMFNFNGIYWLNLILFCLVVCLLVLFCAWWIWDKKGKHVDNISTYHNELLKEIGSGRIMLRV